MLVAIRFNRSGLTKNTGGEHGDGDDDDDDDDDDGDDDDDDDARSDADDGCAAFS